MSAKGTSKALVWWQINRFQNKEEKGSQVLISWRCTGLDVAENKSIKPTQQRLTDENEPVQFEFLRLDQEKAA